MKGKEMGKKINNKGVNKINRIFILTIILVLLINAVYAFDQYTINYNVPIEQVAPRIISWNNNKTNDRSLNLNINTGETIKFSIVPDQTIDNWQWSKDGIIQNNNYDNYSTSWSSSGNKVLKVNGTNSNGMTDTVNWSINVIISTSISSCGKLNLTGVTYVLTTDISSSGTCFTIGAKDITLDGQGHYVNYSSSAKGYGIVDTGGYSNITIRNMKLVQKSTSTSSHGLYFKNVRDSRVDNISITTLGTSSHGIYLYTSNSNTFTGLNISTESAYGTYIIGNYNNFRNMDIVSENIALYMKSAGYNTVKDSSVISRSNYDYYLGDSTANSFMKTNFTIRKILLYDNTSSFNYNNEINNGIWLNTTPIISPTSSSKITRTLINWDQVNISWQEKLSSSRRFRYAMSGLVANANYDVWDGSVIRYNLITDGDGVLPLFDINLTTSARVINVLKR